MTLTPTFASIREVRESRVCRCGHLSGLHGGGIGQCLVHAGEGILACTCTAFELPDPMPMDGPTRFPEGAEI